MYSGQLISYKLSPFPFLRVRWTSEIKNVVPRQYFVDEQKFGPFAMWYHQHFFREKDDGLPAGKAGTEMIDDVSYALPFGLLGRLVNSLLVEKQVRDIFKFRAEAVEKIFRKTTIQPV